MSQSISNKGWGSDQLSGEILAQSAKPFGYAKIIVDSVIIYTRDSATLSAIIARKDTAIALPVILQFNIYAGPGDRAFAMDKAIRDYVGISVNTRGKHRSPQTVEPFEHDAKDAYDIIDWISKQPWCNGEIGMVGVSYVGFSTWAATKNLHPSLKTIAPMVSVAPGIDFPNFNGVFTNYSLRWIRYVTNTKLADFKEFSNDKKWDSLYNVWYKNGRSSRAFDTIEGLPDKIFQRWLQHPSYDSYWSEMIPYKEDFSHINIPVLTITGYYDGDQTGALYYFNEHHKYNKQADHYLLIGPYDHSGATGAAKRVVDGYTIDSAARLFFHNIVLQWFNYVLKDSSRPAILKDKINYQVMGTNSWRHVASMNEISNDTLKFYLANIKEGHHYKLQEKQTKKAKDHIKQIVDFTNRIPRKKDWRIISDTSFNQYEYLSFVTDPIDDRVSVNGRYFADLSFVTNKKDFDIEMELFELMPDGKYFLLSTEYICRASYAKDPAKRQLLQPGEKETMPIRNTFFTSKKLAKGSRLVILLGVPNRNDWQINYGTGGDVSDETIADAKIPLEVKWLTDSWIKVPVYRHKN